jgi:hypothetical protein
MRLVREKRKIEARAYSGICLTTRRKRLSSPSAAVTAADSEGPKYMPMPQGHIIIPVLQVDVSLSFHQVKEMVFVPSRYVGCLSRPQPAQYANDVFRACQILLYLGLLLTNPPGA